MEDITEDNNFSITECKLMISIYKIKFHDGITITDIARECNCDIGNPRFYKVLNYLREKGILEVSKIVGSCKFMKVNYKQLEEEIMKQREVQFWYEFFDLIKYIIG